ncbi:hypothetical protein INT43_002260 [Umbelopsis isabellina]|uniref:mRNA export factor GLE1 n=1 Tax=Mortierella isabellina TaxID=91625 RepID=A0A8H7Q4P1_MORIS|nr:hypothetical protein INT43_002260 [Umbelopsis isabellina]
MSAVRAPIAKPNKCSYSAPSDSDSDSEDEYPQNNYNQSYSSNYHGITANVKADNVSGTRPAKPATDPGFLLHLVSSDRDMWTSVNQDVKRQAWMKAQTEHQKKTQKHLDSIEERRQSIMKDYQQKLDKDAEDVRQFLAKLELDRKTEEERIDKEFEQKNAQMRQMIEKSIKEEKQLQEKKKKEEESKAKALEENKRKEEEQNAAAKKAQADKEQVERENKAAALKKEQDAAKAAERQKSQAYSVEGVEEANKYLDRVKKFREVIKPTFQQNPQWKADAVKSRMKMKRMVGQLTNKRETIMRVIAYHSNLTYFQEQAETEVTVKPSTAYPLAHVSVMLATKHADFIDILMGRLIKHCPYIIPRYYDDDPNRSTDETRKLMGYKYTDKEAKQWEDSVQYKEHMCGLISLWGAIVQTVPEPGVGENPYPIWRGWTWIARLCNIPPRAITPALINAFLEIAGTRMLATYPRQFHKVLRLILEQYLPLLAGDKDAVAAATRLSSYLELYASTGKLGAIEGATY